jgi:molybdopterin converting factor small subunit
MEIDDKDLEYITLEGAFNSQKEYLKSKQEEIDEIKKVHLSLSEDYLEIKSIYEIEKQSRTSLETRFVASESEKNTIISNFKTKISQLNSEISHLKTQLTNNPVSNHESNQKIQELEYQLSEAQIIIKERTEL